MAGNIRTFWNALLVAFSATGNATNIQDFEDKLVTAVTAVVSSITTNTAAIATAVLVTGNQTIAGIKTFSSMPIIPVNADLAAAGSTVTDAAQLLTGFTVVTGANGTLGVKLPATPAAGTLVIIKGTTAGVLKVWPDAAATINAISSNGALSMTTGAMPLTFIAKSATQWYTLPLVAS